MTPIRRLVMVWMLALALVAPARAEAPPSPGPEAGHVTIDEEIQMGEDVAKTVRKKYGGSWNNPAALERVQRIMRKLVAVSDRNDTKLRDHYSVELLDTPAINAMCLPGGIMFVTRGLIELNVDDDELACVMGHEITHAARRHAARGMEMSRSFSNKIAARTKHGSIRLLGKIFAMAIVYKGLDPKLEFEADDYGAIYAARAGFDPDGLGKLFEKFEQLEKGGQKSKWSRLLSSMLDNHPPTHARLVRTRELAAKLKRGETVPTTPVPVYN